MASNTGDKNENPEKEDGITPENNIENKPNQRRSEKNNQDSTKKLHSEDNQVKSADDSTSKPRKLNQKSYNPNKDKRMDKWSDDTTKLTPIDSDYNEETSSLGSRIIAIGSETVYNIARSVLFMLAGNVVFYFIQIVFRPLFRTQSNAAGPTDPRSEQEIQAQALAELLQRIKSAQADEGASLDNQRRGSKNVAEQSHGAQNEMKSKSGDQSVKDKTKEIAAGTAQNTRSVNSDVKTPVSTNDTMNKHVTNGTFNSSALKSLQKIEETSTFNSENKPPLNSIDTKSLSEKSVVEKLSSEKTLNVEDATALKKRTKAIDSPLKPSIESVNDHKINAKEAIALEPYYNIEEEEKSGDIKYNKDLKNVNEISNLVDDNTESQIQTENGIKEIKKRSPSVVVPVNKESGSSFAKEDLLMCQDNKSVDSAMEKTCDELQELKEYHIDKDEDIPDKPINLVLEKHKPQLKNDQNELPSQESALTALVSKFQKTPDETKPKLKIAHFSTKTDQPPLKGKPNEVNEKSLDNKFLKENSMNGNVSGTNNKETLMEHTNNTESTARNIKSSNESEESGAGDVRTSALETNVTLSTSTENNTKTTTVSQNPTGSKLGVDETNNNLKTVVTLPKSAENKTNTTNVSQKPSALVLDSDETNNALKTVVTLPKSADNKANTMNVSQKPSALVLNSDETNNTLKTVVTLPKSAKNKTNTTNVSQKPSAVGLDLDGTNDALKTDLTLPKSAENKTKTTNVSQKPSTVGLDFDGTNDALKTDLTLPKSAENKTKTTNVSQKPSAVGLDLDGTNDALKTDLSLPKSSENKTKTTNVSQKPSAVGLDFDGTNNALKTDLMLPKSAENKLKTMNVSQKPSAVDLDETNTTLETNSNSMKSIKNTSDALPKQPNKKNRKQKK